MSDPKDAKAAEQGPSLSPDQTRLFQTIIETATSATGAMACQVQLHRSFAAPMDPPLAISPEDAPGRALLEFCTELNADPHGSSRTSGPVARPTHLRRITLEGVAYVLFGLVLMDDHDAHLGSMTLGFSATDWDMDDRTDRCRSIGRNVEVLLETFAARRALELELQAVNKRVARLQRIAQTDPLSGLENSASFEEKARQRLKRKSDLAVFVLLDIDHFKSINDLYGHQFGDNYLKCIAGAIANAFPGGSIVGRLGGDEFSVLADMPARGQPHLDTLLSQCRSSIRQATARLGKPDLGRVSIGASLFPDHAESYETLFELADTALYASKDSGRGVTTVFNENVHERYNNRELGKRFCAALAQGRIVPVFQPIVDLRTGACAGYEVLSRWHDEDRGTLEPEQFAAVFTDQQLAERLTRTIVQQSLTEFARFLRASDPNGRDEATLAINLTYFDLMNREFVGELQNTLRDHGVAWASIVIEVAETVMLGTRNGQVFRSLDELRKRGAKVALDDFATGYGGLRHLREWPIDILKIDKAFICNLANDNRDRAIVEGIISIASTCGFEVVAEGIETPEQIGLLRDMRCDFGQGFIFSRPLTCAQLDRAPRTFKLHPATGLSASPEKDVPDPPPMRKRGSAL